MGHFGREHDPSNETSLRLGDAGLGAIAATENPDYNTPAAIVSVWIVSLVDGPNLTAQLLDDRVRFS